RRYQPGQLLQRHLADRHDELGIGRFDYLLGTTKFKEQWANGDYRVGRIIAVPASRPHHRWTLRAADLGADLVRPLRLAARDALTSSRCRSETTGSARRRAQHVPGRLGCPVVREDPEVLLAIGHIGAAVEEAVDEQLVDESQRALLGD